MKTSHYDWRLLSSNKGHGQPADKNLLVRKCISNNNINSYNNGKIEPFWEVGNGLLDEKDLEADNQIF